MPTIKADLHCHSVCSDGSTSLEQLLAFAARQGLTHLALTDHDTLMGVERCTQLGIQYGITVIPAVECTATDYRRARSVHMLCYLPQDRTLLQSFLGQTLENRRIAKLKMVDLLARFYPITAEDVCTLSADSASIHEVHLMQALANLGYTSTVCGDLMAQLIGRKGSCFVPIRYPDVREVVQTIHTAGGLSVLAHPGQFDSLELAQELCAQGSLAGIEAYHPRNNNVVVSQCEQLAKSYGIFLTGGTDFHGMYAKTPYPLGSFLTPISSLERLLATRNK